MKKRTLEEHINRIKELSLIKENDGMTDQQTSQAIDSEEFEIGIENTLEKILSDVTGDLNQLGNKVGDRDGALEIKGESIEINEAGLAIAGGFALAAPKIIEMIGKGTRQLGIAVKSDWIRNAGEAATAAGKKLHHAYGNAILGALRKMPKYKDLPEERQRGIADGILLAATVAAGIASLNGVASALKAGNIGIAAIETALSGVKATEVAEAGSVILPNILNGLFK